MFIKRKMAAEGSDIGGSTTVIEDTATNTEENTTSENVEVKNNDKESNHEDQKMFTQDDVDKIIEKRLARERAKIEKEYADKADKTVNDKLSEAEKLSKMTKEEKREYELSKREQAIAAKEAEYAQRELKISAMSILEDKGITGDTAKQLSSLLDYSDADKCKASIDNVSKLFESLVQKEVNKKIGKNKTPKTNVSNASNPIELDKLKTKYGIK